MMPDSEDARIATILRLVSQLTDHPRVASKATEHGVGDDLDIIIAKLEALVEKTAATDHHSRAAQSLARQQSPAELSSGTTAEIFEESHNIWQATLGSAQDSLLVIAQGGAIAYYNSRFCQMWSLPAEPAHLNNNSILADYVLPQLTDPEQFIAKIEDIGTLDLGEDVLQLKDGRLLKRTSYPLVCENQAASRVWLFQDITEKQQAEEALRLSNFALERMYDAVYWLHAGTIFDVNESACRMLGYSREEFCGMNISTIDPFKPLSSKNWETFRREEVVTFETQHIAKNGRIIPVEVIANYLLFEGKELNCCFVRDITERKRTQEALSQSEDRLRQAVHGGHIGIFDYDHLANTIYWSPEFREIYGWDLAEPVNINKCIAQTHPDDQKRIEQLVNHAQDPSGDGIYSIEYRIIHPSGATRWLSVRLTTSCVGEGSARYPVRTVGAAMDITERKQAEKALRLNNFALERSSAAVYWCNPDNRIVYVNEAALLMLDYSREELLGMTVADIDPSFDFSDKAAVWEAVRNGAPPLETWHRAKDGTLIPVEVTANYIAFENEEFSCSFVTDITERKLVEEALRDSETRYRTLVEGMVDLVSRYQPDTTLTYVNDAYCKFFGKTRNELIGQSYLSMGAPEAHELVRAEAQSLVKEPRLLSGEYLNYAADDTAHWIHWIVQPILDQQGQVVELQSVGRDVTSLKLTEAALRESELLLQKSQEVAQIGSYYLDIKTGQFASSPTMDQIAGIDDRYLKNLEGWRSLIHPDDLDGARQSLGELLAGSKSRTEREYRIIRPNDQQVRWIYGVGELELDDQGNPVKIIGTLQDITERKQAEEALRESELFLQKSQEVAQIGSYYYDLKTNTGVRSPIADQILGVDSQFSNDAEEWFSMVHPDHREDLRQNMRELATGKIEHYGKEYRIIRPNDQQERWIYGVGELELDDQGNPVKIIGTFQDITERKQAEEQIRRLNEELEQRVIERTRELEEANEEIKQFAYIVSHDLRAPLINLKGFAAELRADLTVVAECFDGVMPLIGPDNRDTVRHVLQKDIPESLRFIESSVSNMDSFTRAILKLSRLGRLSLDLVDVDVQVLVEKIVEALNYQIVQQGIRVTIGDLPVIMADFVSMEQVFGNILTNAVTYLDPNRPGEINIYAEQTAEDITFHIRDNGRGIAPHDTDKVFAPFRRAGHQNTPGEGMGLAYVQTLVRRHGGRIWFESDPGDGTTFSFSIPRMLKNLTEEE